ncbi:MAG TPA: alpha/beta hydrolase [Polyangiaceae bacterium]|nr:alpha/beta hydrolase [Polyangiaceae bacterium]
MSGLSRKGWIVLGFAAVVALSLGFFARVFGEKKLRFPYLNRPLTAAAYQALAAEPGWAARQITVAPGIRLNGLVRRPQAADAPWVLFYQGNDADMLKVGQAFLSRLAANRDWGLAIYAYRGFDSSDGTPRLPLLAADAPQILEQLCATEHVDRGRVHVAGFSIGGHIAVRAMVEAARKRPKPPSLTLLASVEDIAMVPRSFYDRFDPGDEYRTGPYLADLPAPILVVQGTKDEALMGPEQGRKIAAALGARAQYLELPGVGHTELMVNEPTLAAVREFIETHR